jgi:hypothetical protein
MVFHGQVNQRDRLPTIIPEEPNHLRTESDLVVK